MTYPRLKLFMEKLDQVIYSKDNPQVSNHPSMLSKMPQFQLLYEELGSVIQILYRDDLHELEEVRNLKKRFKDVADEAHDEVDLFVSVVNFKIKRLPRISNAFEISLNLEDAMKLIKSIKEDYIRILHNKKMESSPRTDRLKTQSATIGGTSCSRISAGSYKVWDEPVVGLDRDINLIRDKLAEDTKKLGVVSVVGMGGLGKTTLATKVFNDPFVVYHFRIRGWVTVSQTYNKTDLLNQILASIGVKIDPDRRNDYSHLHENLHKCLMGRRYLVVVDDIWNIEAWDVLKVVFPDNNTGSRLLLTSRHKLVALHAKPNGFIHQLRYLTDEESWELLLKKVFHGKDFPDWITVIGMQIARNCHGLPLSVVVMAGVLAKVPIIKESWEHISQSSSSILVSELNGHMETLALSLNQLPFHLRECFLYLGGFPEDYMFRVTRLIWLWIAEGFIQEIENQSLEETAKGYAMELANRNLVVVQDVRFNGAIKTFSVHDVLRELCIEVATKEMFFLKSDSSFVVPYRTRRVFTESCLGITNATRILSLLSFQFYSYASYIISKCCHSWMLLVVLDLKQCRMIYFPEDMSLLVNLRYLAIWIDNRDFQYTICELRELQTLIIEYNPLESSSRNLLLLPNTMSKLVNLRHFRCPRAIIFPPLVMPLVNLQTISDVVLGDGPKSWVKYFPGVKKLSCFIYPERKYDFKSLTFLEMLTIRSMQSKRMPRLQKNIIKFPASLKELTLQGCRLPWCYMSKIQCLPNLEALNILKGAFLGPRWDAGEKPFQQLKLLKFVGLDIQQWEASWINFPCLKEIFLVDCHFLERIPHEMRYVPTLQHIEIKRCSRFVMESAYEIQKEQHADGNYDLKISSERWSAHLSHLLSLEELLSLIKNIDERCGTRNIDGRYKHPRHNRSTSVMYRTGICINLLTPHELETLELPIDDPPDILAHHHIPGSRLIRNDGTSKYLPIKRKILKGGGRIKLFQY